MYAEQALRSCARCRAAFAVQYEFAARSAPALGRSEVGLRVVECPHCHHLNRLALPLHVERLVVKAILAA